MAGENEADSILGNILGRTAEVEQNELDNEEPLNPNEDLDEDTGPVEDQDDGPDDQDEDDAGDDAPDDDDDAGEEQQQRRPDENRQREAAPKPGSNDPFNLNAPPHRDKAGNILQNGKIIARAGREARIYYGFRKIAEADRRAALDMGQKLMKVATGAKELFARYDELKQTKNALDRVGLTPEEQTQMTNLAVAYKKNPIEGLKMMLTQAVAAGVDIKSLGVGGGIDPKFLMDGMEERLKALMAPVLKDTSERANRQKDADEATGFFERNKGAREVAEYLGGTRQLALVLKQAKDVAPDISLDELYQRLHYQLLSDGKIGVTGPVARRPNRQERRNNKRSERQFSNRVRGSANESFDDIGRDVLNAIRSAEIRGQ